MADESIWCLLRDANKWVRDRGTDDALARAFWFPHLFEIWGTLFCGGAGERLILFGTDRPRGMDEREMDETEMDETRKSEISRNETGMNKLDEQTG